MPLLTRKDARDPDFLSLALAVADALRQQLTLTCSGAAIRRLSLNLSAPIIESDVARPSGGRCVDVLQAQRRASDGDRQ